MSTPMVLCDNFNIIFSNQRAATRSKSFYSVHSSSSSSFLVVPHLINGKIREKKRFCGLIPNAKKKHKRSWWQKFFFDEEGNWFGLKDDDMIDIEEYSKKSSGDDESEEERELSEGEKFEAWKRRAEAIIELREAQEDMRNQENRNWEDWIIANDGNSGNTNNGRSSSSWVVEEDWTDINNGGVRKSIEEDPTDILVSSGRGLVQSVRDLILGIQDDEDLLYEDRIFRYASFNSAKFLAVLIIVPWALDFLVHDYILMPFLDRYVRTVPLAAQMLDVRRQQKIEMAKELKLEKARYRLEVEIGKSPPLSEEDLWLELRHKTLELRDEWRLENRRAFANIWSDMVFGVSLFILLYFNQSRVALLKFTGYKIINNISDSGKAFLIILVTDIFLGYHSESGWQTLLEVIVEHYGLEVDSSSITIFVCLVPVVIDACVKLWMFKFLPRLSPKVANIFREMKRH